MNWVEELFRRYHLEDEFLRQRALLVWPEIAGERIQRFTRAARVERGVLWVETSSPAVAHELHLLGETYLRALNGRLAGEPLRELRFVPGRVPTPGVLELKRSPRCTASVRAARAVRDVEDQRLKEALERLYARLDGGEARPPGGSDAARRGTGS